LQLVNISKRKTEAGSSFMSPCSCNLTSKKRGSWAEDHTYNPQEAEIRRIMVPSKLGQTVCEILSQNYPTQN
jgi:hypothetical protein